MSRYLEESQIRAMFDLVPFQEKQFLVCPGTHSTERSKETVRKAIEFFCHFLKSSRNSAASHHERSKSIGLVPNKQGLKIGLALNINSTLPIPSPKNLNSLSPKTELTSLATREASEPSEKFFRKFVPKSKGNFDPRPKPSMDSHFALRNGISEMEAGKPKKRENDWASQLKREPSPSNSGVLEPNKSKKKITLKKPVSGFFSEKGIDNQFLMSNFRNLNSKDKGGKREESYEAVQAQQINQTVQSFKGNLDQKIEEAAKKRGANLNSTRHLPGHHHRMASMPMNTYKLGLNRQESFDSKREKHSFNIERQFGEAAEEASKNGISQQINKPIQNVFRNPNADHNDKCLEEKREDFGFGNNSEARNWVLDTKEIKEKILWDFSRRTESGNSLKKNKIIPSNCLHFHSEKTPGLIGKQNRSFSNGIWHGQKEKELPN